LRLVCHTVVEEADRLSKLDGTVEEPLSAANFAAKIESKCVILCCFIVIFLRFIVMALVNCRGSLQ